MPRRESARALPRPAVTAAAVLAAAVAAALAMTAARAAAAEGAPTPDDLLKAADRALHPIEEGAIRIRSTVAKPGEEAVVSDLEVLVRGEDHALCIFRSGPLAGRRILVAGDRVWLLVPGTTRPVPVSASQRLLGGASIGDVARLHFAAEFTAVPRAAGETVDGSPCRVLDLTARAPGAPYAGGTLWVDPRDGRPRRAIFRLPSGKDAKEVRYTEYAVEDGRPILARLEIDHRLPSERGMTTTLEFIGHETRTLDPGTFDPGRARDVP